MKKAGIVVSLFLFFYSPAWCQLDIKDCPKFLVKDKRFLRETIFRSDSSITLKVGEDVIAKLEVNNGGLHQAVNFDFIFKYKTGMGAPAIGDLLVIYFRDNTKDEVYVRSRKAYAGKATFAIVRKTDLRLGPTLTQEDKIFFEKMKMVTISYMEISINSEKHKLRLTATQADWLRSVITCLGALKPY
ncbi:MAG TPA: hypothetical protein VIT44_00650 [Cyclobacteriaceae bacterium]